MDPDRLYLMTSIRSPAEHFDDPLLKEELMLGTLAAENGSLEYLSEDSSPYPFLQLEDEENVEEESLNVADCSYNHAMDTGSNSAFALAPNSAAEVIPTPPPDESLEEYSILVRSESGGPDVKRYTVEETPPSSPSSSCGSGDREEQVGYNPSVCVKVEREEGEEEEEGRDMGSQKAQSVCGRTRDRGNRQSLKRNRSESFDEDSSEEDGNEKEPLPKYVKLPQRKGGMQLWQFLYTLLTDPKKRFAELIDWTDRVKQREFRLQEPEAIAIWWGEHKNKKNMSYDKLSRSLRYYYDKGIIRKIPGERYVYQFCVDPEMMYKHIGNSECRPKLKAMPHSAKMAMSKFHQEQQIPYDIPTHEPLQFIAGMPTPLAFMHPRPPPPSYHSIPFAMHTSPFPPMLPPHHYDNSYSMIDMSMNTSLRLNSYPGPMINDFKPSPPPAVKRHSAPSCMFADQKFHFEHQFHAPPPQSPPLCSAMEPLSDYVTHYSNTMSPATASSCESSPVAPPCYSGSVSESEGFVDLDELIELTSSESYISPSSIIYSSPSHNKSLFLSLDHDSELSTWSFN